MLPALLAEMALYLGMGSPAVRARLDAIRPTAIRAATLAASAVAPYWLYSVPTGVFDWNSFASLALLALIAAYWFVLLPHRGAVDLLFLGFMAAIMLAKPLPGLYARPHPEVRLEFLGQLMWFRLGVLAMLSIRGVQGVGFGMFPKRHEWFIGLRYFVAFLPVAAILGYVTGFAAFGLPEMPAWKIALLGVGTFLGVLWVVALGEEFFFRGLLQQWMTRWWGSRVLGLLACSAVFGLVHLPFREFPNWRFALLAAVAGLFYGRAFQAAKGIRASMVTHALVVTTWRVFFAA